MTRSGPPAKKLLLSGAALIALAIVAIIWRNSANSATDGLPQQPGTPQQLKATSTLRELVLSQDGSVLAAIGQDTTGSGTPKGGAIFLWDAQTLQPLKTIATPQWKQGTPAPLQDLSISPDAKWFAVNNNGQPGLAVYNRDSAQPAWHSPSATTAFTPDGSTLALLSSKAHFEIHQLPDGKTLSQWSAANDNTKNNVEFSLAPDAQTVAILDHAGLVPMMNSTWDTEPKPIQIKQTANGQHLAELKDSLDSHAAHFSPDGTQLVSLSIQGINTPTTDANPDSISNSPNPTGASVGGAIVRCHSSSGKLLWTQDFQTLENKADPPTSFCDVTFSPSGKTIALRSDGPDNQVILLEASTGTVKAKFQLPKGQTATNGYHSALAYSPNGKRLFVRGQTSISVYEVG